ncbi:MAG: hypothetical protein V1932_03375 [Chloroflexota bacterium]
MPLSRILRNGIRCESGATLIETLVALAILGTVIITFLSGIYGSSKAAILADVRATAQSLAQTQMEYTQNATYSPGATWYPAAPIPSSKDYVGYSATINSTPVHGSEDGIQKIAVTISRFGTGVVQIEGYKRQ